MVRRPVLVSLLIAALGCSSEGSTPDDWELFKDPGKSDSGWIGSTSFEVGGVITGTVSAEPRGEWSNVASDPDVQIRLVDAQVRFAKNDMAASGYHINQLVDEILSVEVVEATDANRHPVV